MNSPAHDQFLVPNHRYRLGTTNGAGGVGDESARPRENIYIKKGEFINLLEAVSTVLSVKARPVGAQVALSLPILYALSYTYNIIIG